MTVRYLVQDTFRIPGRGPVTAGLLLEGVISEEELTRRVVFDPRDPTAWPTVGGDDSLMPTVVRALIRRQRATGSWPERGVVEH